MRRRPVTRDVLDHGDVIVVVEIAHEGEDKDAKQNSRRDEE
jgi:hypothetical protein